ncbi:hypothetical protein B9Z55_021792 [Caenorhabditis nigoni]|uniref:DUF38 domain-containing protein n=1 Tax=Caenorhabditis nigoni TaxID=1611254 RepID=A0A2G5TU29_9PELO|nr:hypothetical protein B9Z55_021792 [Caenorhabditis nigoni]
MSTDDPDFQQVYKSCILLDVLTNQPFSKSYVNFKNVHGPIDMDFDEFKFWFDWFSSGNSEMAPGFLHMSFSKISSHLPSFWSRSQERVHKMAESLKKTNTRRDSVIIYLFLQRKSLEEIDGIIQKWLGQDFIEYTELEYRFYKFYARKKELDQIGGVLPKLIFMEFLAIEEKPKNLCLTDYGDQVVSKKLVRYFSLEETFRFHLVCSNARKLVSMGTKKFQKIEFRQKSANCTLKLDDFLISYENYLDYANNQFPTKRVLNTKDRGNMYLDAADGILGILRSSRLRIYHLLLNFSGGTNAIEANKLLGEKLLKYSQDSKIRVDQLSITTFSPEMLKPIFEYLKPGDLKKIHLEIQKCGRSEFYETKQWKSAKQANLILSNLEGFENVEDFEKIEISLLWRNYEDVKVEHLIGTLNSISAAETFTIAIYSKFDYDLWIMLDTVIPEFGIWRRDYSGNTLNVHFLGKSVFFMA